MRTLLITLAFTAIVTSAFAQWNYDNQSVIYSNSGNVGIGTNAPSRTLDVNGIIGINGVSVINTSNSNGSDIYLNGRVIRNESTVFQDGMLLNYNSNGTTSAHLRFYANGTTERMRIDASTGNVGIGLSSSIASRLHVQGAGNSTVDFRVNGRMLTGDANNNGGVWLNSGQTMLVGQENASIMGLYNSGWRLAVRGDNGSVGVGTTDPQSRLHVVGGGGNYIDLTVNGRIATGDASNNGGIWLNNGQTMLAGQESATTLGLYNAGWRLAVANNGYVGIGTTTPHSKLHVVGGGNNLVDLIVNGRIGTGDSNNNGGIWLNSVQNMLIGQESATTLGFYNAGWKMVVADDGNVGIGTTTPDSKLCVKGDVHTKEVRVDLAGAVAPDYVFEEDYKLTSLSDLEIYLKLNKHLPEVPSAKQFEEEGMKLKEMNLLLLKKVEELTLYVIELKKENEEQQKALIKLMNKSKIDSSSVKLDNK